MKTMLLATIMIAACTTSDAPAPSSAPPTGYQWTIYTHSVCSNGLLPETSAPFSVCVSADALDYTEPPGEHQAAVQALAWKWGCEFQQGRIAEATDPTAEGLTCVVPGTTPPVNAPYGCEADPVPTYQPCQAPSE